MSFLITVSHFCLIHVCLTPQSTQDPQNQSALITPFAVKVIVSETSLCSIPLIEPDVESQSN